MEENHTTYPLCVWRVKKAQEIKKVRKF